MTSEVRSDARVTMRFEPPDVLYISFAGEVDEADMNAAVAEVRRASDSGRPVFVLADVVRLRSIMPAARKAAAHGMRGVRERGCVIMGASFHIRVLFTLILKAMAFVREPAPFAVVFLATEPEACAWIDAQRSAQDAEGRGDLP